jgi:drug/metabolite transporter (DMT)-like permease
MPRSVAVGVVLTVVSACAFGSGALFAKPVYAAGVGWHVLMAWRFLLGASLAWVAVLARPAGRSALHRLGPRAVAVAIGLGVLYTGNSGTYYAGLETVSASLAALIVYVYPALVAVISLGVGQALGGRRAWTGLAFATAGVAIVVGNIDAQRMPPLTGLALVIASPIIYSIWIVLSARLSGERRSGAGMESEAAAAPIAAGAIMLTATAATYWVSALAVGRPVLPAQVLPAAWPGIAGLGIVSTFIAVQGFYAGAHRIGAARASLVSTVEPIWTIALASLLLGESLGPAQLLGGAMILAGVVIAETGRDAGARGPELRIADE